jgi:hypothetical protein
VNTNKIVAILCLVAAYWLNHEPGSFIPGLPDSPVPGSGLHVLIVEDRLHRQSLPPEQFDAIMSSDVDELIRSNNGHKYLYDQNQDVSTKDDPWVQSAMKLAKDKTLPWLIMDNNGHGTSESMPKEPRAFKDLVQSYLK